MGFVLESHSSAQHGTAPGKIFGSCKGKKDASLQLWLRHPQHRQPLADTGLGVGHLSDPKHAASPPDNKHFSAGVEPSGPQISAASTTQIFKTWQWVVPAGFDSLLTFAELRTFKPILQLLNFPPQNDKRLLFVIILLFYFI